MSENDNSSPASLKGHLLLAMPQMGDPRFHRAVIFLCVHDNNGAMGITINQPLPATDFPSLLGQLGLTLDAPLDDRIKNMPVLSGGPVEGVRGFLLHSPDFRQKDTILIDDHFSISGTLDSLRAVMTQDAPEHMLFSLGYAGWGAGQLEKELQENAWIVVPASHELVFKTPIDSMWEKSYATLGINPAMLSGVSGNA